MTFYHIKILMHILLQKREKCQLYSETNIILGYITYNNGYTFQEDSNSSFSVQKIRQKPRIRIPEQRYQIGCWLRNRDLRVYSRFISILETPSSVQTNINVLCKIKKDQHYCSQK